MTEYTRLTIVGSTRKADLVVPGDEAIGSLIPRLMQLLDERPGAVSRPLTLVRSTGEQLDTSLSIAEQAVYDGELLRLLREDAAPPPPEVADVTDVLADTYSTRRDLWSIRSRCVVSASTIGAITAVAGLLLIDRAESLLGSASVALPVLAAVYAIAIVGAVIAGRVGGDWTGAAFTAIAAGAALPLGVLGVAASALPTAPGGQVLGDALAEQVPAVSALVWVALAAGIGAGLASRAAWWGGVIGALSSALPLALATVGVDRLGAFGITAVVTTLVCGLLPWYAMSASGLTGLDDQVVEGRLKRRDSVLVTVEHAYRTLTWSTAAVAVPLAVSSAALVGSADGWAVGLGAATVTAIASRTRAMPLAAQGYALWTAALTGLVVGAALQLASGGLFAPWVVFAVLAVALIAALIAGGASPPAHRRASLRRVGNLAESFAVAAMLPLLVGLFGIYGELLGAFG